MTRRSPRRTLLAVMITAVLAVSGCGLIPGVTVEQIPLPAPGGLGESIHVTAEFDNALNLPTRAKVKLNGTDVGQVREIVAENYTAVVTMQVTTEVKLPIGTGAELRQATPLGDVFVALLPPPGQPTGYMSDGDTLTGPTSAAATVEDILVSTAGVVDSGSLSSLQVILTELSRAVSANPDELSGSIEQLTTAITKFNQNSAEVDESMRSTQILTAQLAAGRAQIMASINKLAPAVNAVNSQISSVLTTLDKAHTVTAATNDFLNSDQDNLVALVQHLATLLSALRQAAGTFGPLSDNLAMLTPKWVKATSGSAAALSAKVYYLNPGVGFDSGTRAPELQDIDEGSKALQQTLTRLLARLTGTKGCCG
ncbi:MlaD family protein [Gordonia sp. NPDC003424]